MDASTYLNVSQNVTLSSGAIIQVAPLGYVETIAQLENRVIKEHIESHKPYMELLDGSDRVDYVKSVREAQPIGEDLLDQSLELLQFELGRESICVYALPKFNPSIANPLEYYRKLTDDDKETIYKIFVNEFIAKGQKILDEEAKQEASEDEKKSNETPA